MPRGLTIDGSLGQLHSDTDVASIEPAVAAAPGNVRLQFDEPLLDAVLAATADVIRRYPEVELRAYGSQVDPTLSWLSGFEHVEHLALDLWYAASFDRLVGFTSLRSLSLGETASKRPSLSFLRDLPQLEVLWLEAHDKDFDAVGEVESLRRLHLRVPRVKTLDSLRGHTNIEVLSMSFGGVRDLSPLADLPRLRGFELYQVRNLDTGDLDALGTCCALEAVSLGALRNVGSLRAFGQGPSSTLRFLTLERLTGLATLADLASCQRLEQLGLYESRPTDKRLDVLLGCPNLTRLVVGDVYPNDQLDALRDGFGGDTLLVRGEAVRGDRADVKVLWRMPVHKQLADPT
ncbi:MAG: hypothetical protein QOH16_1952 [Gaiellaceae bacterium]|nr:hypothetical protein [Gaiellaceae bacterium]